MNYVLTNSTSVQGLFRFLEVGKNSPTLISSQVELRKTLGNLPIFGHARTSSPQRSKSSESAIFLDQTKNIL